MATTTAKKVVKKLVVKKKTVIEPEQQMVDRTPEQCPDKQPVAKSRSPLKKNKEEEWKSFRLFDFETCDRVFELGGDSDTDSSCGSERGQRKKKPKTFVVQMFGINEIGETVSITIPDFKPYFYIQVGQEWTEKEHRELVQEIKHRIGSYWATGILNSRLERHSDLYHFNGSQQVFVRLSFQNTIVMNQVKNLWFHSWVEGEDRRKPAPFHFPKDPRHPQYTLLRLFESNIPPLLRCFHIHDISPSGWIQIPVGQVETPLDPQTTCTYEYTCKISQLKAQPEKETGVPYKICSFDIEASSSHGQFPLPIKNYRSTAIQIYDTFITHMGGDKKTPQKMDELLSKLVLTAFRFKRFDGIDHVFPKRPPSQSEIEQAIQKLLKSDVVLPKDNGRLNDLLAIDQIYKKASIVAESTMDVGVGGDGDEGDEDWGAPEETPVIMTQSFSQWLAEPAVADRDTKINTLNRRMTALFPALEGDKITFIGSTFVLQGQDLPYKNHCLALGDCGPVEGAEIQCCQTEADLLLAWTDLIQKENPDILIGYNIFGFDYDFMFRRAQENDCAEAFMRLSRQRGHISCKRNEKTDELSLEQKKIVIASGPFDMKYFNMIGRFQIDLYTYFRREFNLSSYKLDDVAGEYICDKVSKIDLDSDGEGNTVIYSKNLKGLQVGDYVHLMTVEYTTEYLNGGQKYSVLAVESKGKDRRFTIAGKVVVPPLDKNVVIRWGLAKDDVSPQDIFRMAGGTLEERAKVAKYCIQDCNIVQQLLMKIDVLTGYNEMARICSVPMKFLVFRGQGIKLTSCMAKFCRLRNTLMPDLTAVEEDMDANYDYEGAIVLPPKCGMYIDDPVACVDYSSLYPTIIISNNLSQDSKVWVKEYDAQGKLIKYHNENAHYDMLHSKGYDYIDIEYENFTKLQGGKKAITGKTVCRFAQFPDEQKGIIPSILEDILVARKKTRKMAEAETDDFMKNILDKRQLAYKVTANSIYGQCGSRTSTFYDKDIAACTTATGRKMILYAKKMVEDVYGNHRYTHPKFGELTTSAEYIYGDTDSVFMTFHIRRVNPTDPTETTPVVGKEALEITIELAKEVARLCSMNLKKPMELTYEKTLMPFIILSKKRYVGMLYEDDTEHCKLKFMGLSIKRRDCCDYLKDVFGGVLNRFLYNSDNKTKLENVQSAMEFLQVCLKQLVLGKVPMEKLTITKSLRDYYKTPQQIAHWVLAQRIAERDPGNKPRPGERMKYAFVVVPTPTSGKRLLQGDKIETPAFIHQTQAKLDYHHYITNQLMKPLLQLFGLVVEEILTVQGKKMDLVRYKKDLDSLRRTVYDSPGASALSEETLLEFWTKRKEKINEIYAHDTLFRPTLTDITNRQKGLKNITQFF